MLTIPLRNKSVIGICQVLDFMVDDALKARRLVEVLSGFAAEGPPIHALTLAGRAASVSTRAVLDVLTETLRRPEARRAP